MSERLNEIRQHLEGPTTSPLFLLDACRWLVDEVERVGQVRVVVGQLSFGVAAAGTGRRQSSGGEQR